MKQIIYSVGILLILCVIVVYHSGKIVVPEHSVQFLFEKEGCKVYTFKTFESLKYKTHFFTTCKGHIVDPDEMNLTEVNNEE